MDSDAWMPLARQDDLVTTPSGDELLVYDPRHHHLHHLNPFAAAVWHACDGQRSVAAIAARLTTELGVTVDPGAVRLALTQLTDADLLAVPISDHDRIERQSRRHLLRKAVAAGLALPAIASVTAPDAAAQTSCPAPLTQCPDGACIDSDTNTDLTHCGTSCLDCTSFIPPNMTPSCVDGTCYLTCNAGYDMCGGFVCRAIASDPNHCGSGCTTCSAPANATPTCVNGVCQWSCNAGYSPCGDACIATATDPNHCGSCGNICSAPENGTATCVNGECQIACNSGYGECYSGVCLNITSDPMHCGACFNNCEGGSCVNGQCVTCPPGTARCVATCCDEGVPCVNGQCLAPQCPPGFTECGEACIDTASDSANCGECGNVCPGRENGVGVCDGGVCRIDCNDGFEECVKGSCIDISSHYDHCGGCNQPCDGACFNGSCASHT